MLQIVAKYTYIPIPIPKNPQIYPSIVNINLYTLKWNPKEKLGITNEDNPVIATTIIKIGLTIFAATAASPKINAPTIPRVDPIAEGVLSPPSRISSKEISISKSSNIIGNGTFSLATNIENRSSVGKSSWWKFVIAIYIPGSSKVMINAINLITFKKFANKGTRFESSGDARKSVITDGIIRAYGFPFTSITALPWYIPFTHLSGLSVDKIWGIPALDPSWINCSNSPEDTRLSIEILLSLYLASAIKSPFAIFCI